MSRSVLRGTDSGFVVAGPEGVRDEIRNHPELFIELLESLGELEVFLLENGLECDLRTIC